MKINETSNLFSTTPAIGARKGAADDAESFTALIGDMAQSTTQALKGAEAASMKALRGDADPRMVAESVMQAEQALQTSIAVRDKLVASFQEIMRMSI